MEKKIDRRILKSKKAIETTFLKLLAEESFDEIAVKRITEEADISRKTFYLHYIDKYDLLENLVDQKLEELRMLCDQKKDLGFLMGTMLWFEYFQGEREFFTPLFKSQSTVSFRKQMLSFMEGQIEIKIQDYHPEKNSEVLRKFLSMAVLGLIESWHTGELRISMIDLSKEVGELLEKNIIGTAKGAKEER